jgi:hypothetical protein
MTTTLTEAALLATIRQACQVMHLLCYHTHDARRSTAGFPDLVIVGPGGCLFRELKTATGRATGEQGRWLDALGTAGMDAGLWRPADLVSQRITNELGALRRTAVRP